MKPKFIKRITLVDPILIPGKSVQTRQVDASDDVSIQLNNNREAVIVIFSQGKVIFANYVSYECDIADLEPASITEVPTLVSQVTKEDKPTSLVSIDTVKPERAQSKKNKVTK